MAVFSDNVADEMRINQWPACNPYAVEPGLVRFTLQLNLASISSGGIVSSWGFNLIFY